MKMEGTADLPYAAADVWAALHDVDILVKTIPGCKSMVADGEDAYRIALSLGVASIKGEYEGKIRVTDIEFPHHYVLYGEGAGKPGFVNVNVECRLDEIVLWCYRRRIPTVTPLVIVVDVSGSMEIYSVFLLNFLHLLSRNRWLKIEVFIFSTDLQSMTAHFRRKNFRAVLDSVSRHFSGWSGGTKIGEAIKELNTTYATAITPKTVVTIISDGWDTGDAELLDHEMAKVAGRAKSIVWINPLKGDPGYEPLAQGMAIARPYCNEFISGHSIDSLDRFASLLEAEA